MSKESGFKSYGKNSYNASTEVKAPKLWGFNTKVFWGVFLFAMILKYAYYGLSYFPVVDDHNMYGMYSLANTDLWHNVVLAYNLYTTRPLATILDAYVWSRLWDYQWIILAIMAVLHTAGCYFVWKIFDMNKLRVGVISVILLGLLPLSAEAVYWISASSRIVTGFFFGALSLFLLMLYIESQEKSRGLRGFILTMFFITHLISMGFYEQTVALSFFGALIIIVCNFKRIKYKPVVSGIPFVCIGCIAAYYKIFGATGNVATRGKLVSAHYVDHTLRVLGRVGRILSEGNFEMIKNGLVRFAGMIVTDTPVVFILLSLVIAFMFSVFARFENVESGVKPTVLKILGGVMLVLVPIGPFFLMDAIWICNRNIFLSLIGVGMLVEAVLLVVARGRAGAIIKGVLAGLMVLVFLFVNAAEMGDNKKISVIDREIVVTLNNTLSDMGEAQNGKDIIVFNTKPIYMEPIYRHFDNCTAVDWAFMGAVNASRLGIKTEHIQPVENNTEFSAADAMFDKALYIGMNNDRTMLPLTVKSDSTAGSSLALVRKDGSTFGWLDVTTGGKYKLRMNQ